MTLGAQLAARIESAAERYGRGRPIAPAELRERLGPLGLKPDPGYQEFVGRWGGCFVGVPVHAWDNAALLGRETCVELTTWARDGFGDLVDGLVIADDGAGNPIWIAPDGAVRLTDHDTGTTVTLTDSFRAFLDPNVHD